MNVLTRSLLLLLLGLSGRALALDPGCAPNDYATQFADVDGDGWADAIVSNQGPNGGLFVRRSDRQRFLLPAERWTEIPYWGTKGLFFADVDGDGKADAIVVNDGGITVRRSDGKRFLPNEPWTSEPYFGTIKTAFADVDGDMKADAIVVNGNGITVRRSDADGHRFKPNEPWATEPFSGSHGTYFADVDGDFKADAIALNNDTIMVRLSNGNYFLNQEVWATGPVLGSRGTVFADVGGDRRADLVIINDDKITVRRAVYLGNHLAFSTIPVDWTSDGFYGDFFTRFANVYGTSADAIAVNRDGIVVRRWNVNKFGPRENWTNDPYYGDYEPICLN